MRTIPQLLPDDDSVPNNPRWPLILYVAAIDPGVEDLAAEFERTFAEHGWGDGWRNGIFDYEHYHPSAHEVLGIARGRATVQFGGRSGAAVEIKAGDAVLLPAGTGHQRLTGSTDLLVIGAYPPGQSPEIRRSGQGDTAAMRARVKAVKKPATDPIGGVEGPMVKLWRE